MIYKQAIQSKEFFYINTNIRKIKIYLSLSPLSEPGSPGGVVVIVAGVIVAGVVVVVVVVEMKKKTSSIVQYTYIYEHTLFGQNVQPRKLNIMKKKRIFCSQYFEYTYSFRSFTDA